MKSRALISAKDLSIGYTNGKHKNVLYSGLSFDLYSGELTCLLGSNGAGKSTLLRTISAMQSSIGGEIFIEEKNIKDYSEQDLSQYLGLVLTDKTSVGGLTVRELVSLGRYPYTGFWGRLTKDDKEVVEKSLCDVCIIHKAERYMAELSDGERQKVMIAKALAQECPIILLDEPTAFLDVASRIEIMNLLHQLVTSQDKAILLSTHDIELAFMLADRLWLLSEKKGLTCGVTEDIILSDNMSQFFSKNNIVFEKESGRFRSKPQGGRKIYLIAEDELYYWAQNLLQRQGFNVTDKSSDINLTLEARSPRSICFKTGEKEREFSSFEEFVIYLKEEF